MEERPPPLLYPDLSSLQVRLIATEERDRWDSLMREHHYLGFGWLAGESLKHVAILDGTWVALLGWATPALKVSSRDRWIGWVQDVQYRRLRYVANNTRFLVLPGDRIKNLASKALALSLSRLSSDWNVFHGHPVHLAETFVDPSRFAGTCYRASGWLCLGTTRGFGYRSGSYYRHGQPKTVWVRPLSKNFRELLAAPFDTPALTGETRMSVALPALPLEGPEGLWSHLEKIPEFRKKRGIRHPKLTTLKVIVCGILSGALHAKALGEWSRSLSQDLLERLHCHYSPKKERFVPPSWTTLHRTIRSLDSGALEEALLKWVTSSSFRSPDLAVDGKTLRGSASEGRKAVHLLSAFFHLGGLTVAHIPVGEKSNEIPAFRTLLAPLDLAGITVTADAMHTQRDHARFLVEEKQAHFVMTVKENQPQVHDALSCPANGAFSPREKTAETIDKEHGRLEHRKIQLFDPDLAAYVKDDLAFPHVLQTFKITRTIRHMKTGRVATEVAYGLTSHSEESASPADLLKKVRSHWSIENSLHWVKDVVLGEDRSTVHVGNGPRNMATFRNLAIALGSSASRKSGFASLLRQFAWNRETVLDFLRV